MELYRVEHRDFPILPEAGELAAMGFVDQSWHNNMCPHFVHAGAMLSVWIEHPDAAQRENPERYCVGIYSEDHSDEDNLYIGDDWQAALAAIDSQLTAHALQACYENREEDQADD
jgi:hypothetical protein